MTHSTRIDELPNSWHELGATLSEIVEQHSRLHPNNTALIFRGRSISYQEFSQAIAECASALRKLGLVRGDRLALLSPPRPEAMIVFIAATKLGVIWLGLNPKYQPRELNYFIDHAKPKRIISIDEFDGVNFCEKFKSLEKEGEEFRIGDVIYFENLNSNYKEIINRLNDGSRCEANTRRSDLHQPANAAMLVYTSGTTGKPKGALLRERDLIYRSYIQSITFPTNAPPIAINYAPINHVGGFVFRGLSQIVAGGSVVYMDKFNAAEAAKLIKEHGVNMLMMGPTVLQMLLDEPSFDLDIMKRLDWFIFAGAPLSVSTLKLIHRYCPNIGAAYGLTESVASVSFARTPKSLEAIANTIGRPHLEGEMRVVGGDGKVVPIGKSGELQIRSEHCMIEYYLDPSATKETITSDGWLNTGDAATLTSEGDFKLVGRIKEMYKSGGYNIYPREIESVLEEHPEIMLSAVVPVDDPLYQQVGHAFVKLYHSDSDVTAERLIAWCRDRMANYKVPKKITILDSLPIMPTGKTDKLKLKSIASEL